MATTAHLGITLIEQAQAQKEVTANEAFARVDALLNGGAKQAGVNMPPSSPVSGDVYIIGAAPTGAWAGKEAQIAYFDQVWRFIIPQVGSSLWVNDAGMLQVFDGVNWRKSSAYIGFQNVEVSASAMLPALTNGCAALARVALGANQPDVVSLDFDASVVEYAVVALTPPPAWNGQPFTAEFLWSHATASGSFGVVWSLQALTRADNEALNTAYSSAVSLTDTGGVANRLYVSPRSTVITSAGTVTAGGLLYLRMAREATAGGDTLAVDARLHAVRVFFDM
jgi:Protein of unknown function (DUF2793)